MTWSSSCSWVFSGLCSARPSKIHCNCTGDIWNHSEEIPGSLDIQQRRLGKNHSTNGFSVWRPAKNKIWILQQVQLKSSSCLLFIFVIFYLFIIIYYYYYYYFFFFADWHHQNIPDIKGDSRTVAAERCWCDSWICSHPSGYNAVVVKMTMMSCAVINYWIHLRIFSNKIFVGPATGFIYLFIFCKTHNTQQKGVARKWLHGAT